MSSQEQSTAPEAAPSNVEWQEGRVNKVYRLWHLFADTVPGSRENAVLFAELDDAMRELRLPPGKRWMAQTSNKERQRRWREEHPDEAKAVLRDMKRQGARLTQGAA